MSRVLFLRGANAIFLVELDRIFEPDAAIGSD